MAAVAKDGEISAGARRLRSRIQRHFSSVEAEHLTTFASRLLAKGGSAYAEALGDEQLMALVGSAFRFFVGAGRLPRIRVFNPQLSTDGWEPEFTIIETCMEDSPFVGETLRMCLKREGIVIRHMLHPAFVTHRERDGGLIAVRGREEEGARESFAHVAVDRIAEQAILAGLESSLHAYLDGLDVAMRDQRAMRDGIEAIAQDLEWIANVPWARGNAPAAKEAAAFLRWLTAGSFVLTGYEEFRAEDSPGGPTLEELPDARLGIARMQADSQRDEPRNLPERTAIRPDILTVTESTVDNVAFPFSRMYEVDVQRVTADGRVLGEITILGAFTSKAFSQDSAEVPVLRRMLAEILDAEDAVAGSHEYNDIVTVFNGFPMEELFRAAPSSILEDIRALLDARPDRVTVTTRETPTGSSGRRLSVIVSVPGRELSTDARGRIQDVVVSHTGGTLTRSHLAPGCGERVNLHLCIEAGEKSGGLADHTWASEVAAVVHSWDDQLLGALEARYPAAEARRIAARFGSAFSAEYRAVASVETTVSHIGWILEMERLQTPQVTLARASAATKDQLAELRIYRPGDTLVAAELVTLLENMGLRARPRGPLVVAPADGSRVFVYAFDVGDSRGGPLDLELLRERLEAAVLAIHDGEVDDDILNGLVVTTDLEWRGVDCLRTVCGYGYQVGLAARREEIYAALVENPAAARALFNLFCARFAPRTADDPAAARESFRASVDKIPRPVEALILKNLGEIVEAVVRTNFFRPLKTRRPCVAIKIDGSRLGWLARQLREIYVQSSRVEGLHLKSSRTARSVIVHCESGDGLRARLLRCLTNQEVSSAVTVPFGASGGFVVKRTRWRNASGEEANDARGALIRAILDLTDNRAGGDVQRPRGEQVYEEEDSFFVIHTVEGDSVLGAQASAIVTEYGFWLGDACASSGGLPDHDTGRLEIAARGTWECVRAHLRESGRLVDEPIVVVGTGDMTDGLFGRGMLLSSSVQLRAALSRSYLFLDPNPDPEQAFAERARLARDRLGWEAYDTSKLGQGGMIVPRAAKQVRLSPEARAFLGLGDGELSAEGVTRAILHAKADVLWTGEWETGIEPRCESWAGTSGETATPLEVDGCALRTAVVAEGGNVGLPHRARVEYAMRGGRINAPVIDGAGADDLADREVNLKILFQPLLESGALSRSERDRILGEVFDEAAARVLSRVRSQHRALSFDQRRSQRHLAEYREAAAWLAEDAAVSPALDFFPDRRELRARRGRYPGLTRPELGVVLACTKSVLKRRLLDSHALLDDPVCEPFLAGYFPSLIPTEFAGAVREHVLRREIVAAELANQLVDTSGCTFVHRVVRDADVGVSQAVRAWVIAFELADGRDLAECLWGDGESGIAVTAEAAIQVQGALVSGLERLVAWVLGNVDPDRAPCDVTRELRAGLGDVRTKLPGCFSRKEAELFHQRATEFEMAGLAADLARRLSLIDWMDGALDVAAIASETGALWEDVARLFYGLSGWLDFPWLLARIGDMDDEDVWEHRAARGLTEDLSRARSRLVRRFCKLGAKRAGPDALGRQRSRAERAAWVIADLKGSARVSPAALQVVVRELGRLCEVE